MCSRRRDVLPDLIEYCLKYFSHRQQIGIGNWRHIGYEVIKSKWVSVPMSFYVYGIQFVAIKMFECKSRLLQICFILRIYTLFVICCSLVWLSSNQLNPQHLGWLHLNVLISSCLTLITPKHIFWLTQLTLTHILRAKPTDNHPYPTCLPHWRSTISSRLTPLTHTHIPWAYSTCTHPCSLGLLHLHSPISSRLTPLTPISPGLTPLTLTHVHWANFTYTHPYPPGYSTDIYPYQKGLLLWDLLSSWKWNGNLGSSLRAATQRALQTNFTYLHCIRTLKSIGPMCKQLSMSEWKQTDRKRPPDSKIHGAYMGSTWGQPGPGGPYVGPMNLAIRDHLCLMYNTNLKFVT